MEDRFSSTESFLDQAKTRVVSARQEVAKARDALTFAETKLVLEGDAVRDKEERLLLLRQQATGVPGSKTCHSSRRFHAGIGTIARTCSGSPAGERRYAIRIGRSSRKKWLRGLSSPSADLSMPLLNKVTTHGASARNASLMMETMIDHAELTIRFGQQLMNFT